MPAANPQKTQEILGQVLRTEALRTRLGRAPDYAVENRALVDLARSLSSSPQRILDVLAGKALELCSAGSAGISILEEVDSGESHFRWHALAGAWAPYVGAVMPRDYSPCGVVLDHGAPQLMSNLSSYYDYVEQMRPTCYEVLLVPFYSKGIAVGTIWVVKHDADSLFDSEDERRLTSLAVFSSAAYEILKNHEQLQQYAIEQTKRVASLADADRSKDAFIATIAHELRNPLGPIRTAASLLKHAHLEPVTQKHASEIIERQALKMSRLVDDLMDVSRVRLGNLELKLQSVNVAEVLGTAVEASTLLTSSSSHQLRIKAPTAPLWVMGDPMRLTQVFENLLNNAAKYTDPNGAIEVQLSRDGPHAVVSLRDSGIGIAPDKMDSIFDLFCQAGQAGSPRSQGGLGIGLHLARRLVEAHHGTLSAESAGAGCGSTFIVRLPLTDTGAVSG